MAIPADAKLFEESIDPYDVLDFEVNLAPLLEVGEAIGSYTVSLPAESTLFGLQIKTTGGYSTSLTANVLQFYVGIDPAEIANAAFVAGVTLPIEISITTDAVPARKKQRTVALKVIQK